MKSRKSVLIWLLLLQLFSLRTNALEPQDPQTLCDRYITEAEQKICQKKVKMISPDWYLASACGHQFDDGLFYSCLEMGQKTGFAPLALEKCSSEDLTDEARLTCVKSAQIDLTKSFQSRQPAGRKKPSRKPSSDNK